MKPIRGTTFDNMDRYLKFRQDTWKARLAREEYLEKVVKTICSVNYYLHKFVWAAKATGLDVETFDTCLALNWDLYYPYVAGDDEYEPGEEARWKEKYSCRMFVNILGSEVGDFRSHIRFNVKNDRKSLEEILKYTEKEFAKTIVASGNHRIAAPDWFIEEVERIVKHNSKYIK